MVVLSSFYVYIVRILAIFTIFINVIGILIIKFLLPKDQAITYDLTFPIMLIFMCSIILLIYLNLNYVSLNVKERQLTIKKLRKEKKINVNNVLKVERFFFLFCNITYKENNIRKSVVFLPKFREFFPFTDFPQRIKELLK